VRFVTETPQECQRYQAEMCCKHKGGDHLIGVGSINDF
jgi:hypothetical protein